VYPFFYSWCILYITPNNFLFCLHYYYRKFEGLKQYTNSTKKARTEDEFLINKITAQQLAYVT